MAMLVTVTTVTRSVTEGKGMWTRVIDNATLASLAHQVAEQVTVALAEISLARRSAISEREFADAVERAEAALLQVRDPLQRLTTELATIAENK
jgi:hypothetical protein